MILDAASKRDLYALGARVFAMEIDAELLARLVASQSASEMTLVDDELVALDRDHALEELAAEYCRLFIGPRPPCPPFAAVHRGEALLGGRSGARLLELFERHGLELLDVPAIASPDHVAVPLAALATLYGETAIAATEAEAAPARQATQELLAKCVLPWVPDYLALVTMHARREPYTSVAKLLAALLEQEREELA